MTFSPTTLLLSGVAVALVVILVVMLRRPKPTRAATSPRTDLAYCEQCGAQSPSAKQFCEKCGAKLKP
jgi:hypothetical protein